MKINKEKLNTIAVPLSAQRKYAMRRRRADRHLYTASSAIVAKITRQMRLNGITKTQLAKDLGVTGANITRYLNGKCNFELRTLVELERVLGITIIDRNVATSDKSPNFVILRIDNSLENKDDYINADLNLKYYEKG